MEVFADSRHNYTVYFEEFVERNAPDVVRINADKLKVFALQYFEKTVFIFKTNFGEYFAKAQQQPPFDPFMYLI